MGLVLKNAKEMPNGIVGEASRHAGILITRLSDGCASIHLFDGVSCLEFTVSAHQANHLGSLLLGGGDGSVFRVY